MPRKKQFDVYETLNTAMTAFWETGYKATSVQVLVKRMGINPYSMYDTYGDKRELFEASYDRYMEEHIRIHIDALKEATDPMAGLIEFLENYILKRSATEGFRGCFATNTLIELAPHDPEFGKCSKQYLSELQGVLTSTIKAAQKAKQIKSKASASELAEYLCTMIQGLNVICKTKPQKKTLRTIVDNAFKVLEPAKKHSFA